MKQSFSLKPKKVSKNKGKATPSDDNHGIVELPPQHRKSVNKNTSNKGIQPLQKQKAIKLGNNKQTPSRADINKEKNKPLKQKIFKTKSERLEAERNEIKLKKQKVKGGNPTAKNVKYHVPSGSKSGGLKGSSESIRVNGNLVSNSPKLNKPKTVRPKLNQSVKQVGVFSKFLGFITGNVGKSELEKRADKLRKKHGVTDDDIYGGPPKEKVNPYAKLRDKNWGYTDVQKFDEDTTKNRELVFEEIKDEKVVARRAKIETVKDINDVSFLERINLVTYFNQKESGKLDEKYVREEYLKNTEILKKENSLKYFLLESARRNLEYGEYPEIKIQIDPKLETELFNCIESKLLASYEIIIERQHEILTKMRVDPIIISMRLKTM